MSDPFNSRIFFPPESDPKKLKSSTDIWEGYTPLTFSTQQRLLLNAIIEVECDGDLDAIGDNGNAIGGLQIWYIYWHDAQEYLGYKPAPVSSPDAPARTWGRYLDCYNLNYAERMLDAWMKRYAKKAWSKLGSKKPLSQKDFLKYAEEIARKHNGGPNGMNVKKTLKYWKEVKIELADGPPPRPIQPDPLG